jgi:hypothetical protein
MSEVPLYCRRTKQAYMYRSHPELTRIQRLCLVIENNNRNLE